MAIIKCPECGHEVSDQAPHCPFCGVDIVDNIVTCPDCGKILLKKEKTCPNCGCSLVAAPIDPRQTKRQSYTSSAPAGAPEPKKGNKNKAILITIIVVVVLALGIGAYIYMENQSSKNQMENEYQALENDTNTADYEDYLSKYPDSPHAQDVTDRLNRLKQIQNKWMEISLSSSKADFVNFMSAFPNSPYDEACKNKIDSLDWIDASTENTAEAYQRYLSEHPQGKYVDLCNKGKESLDKMTVSYSDRSSVRDIMNKYFKALSDNSTDELTDIVADKMYDQTASFMTKLHNGKEQVNFAVKSSFNVSKAPYEGSDFVYIAKFRLEKSDVDAAGTANKTLYNVSATVSPDMKVISMKMQKDTSAGE